MSVSKRTRFEIFKRDGFKCQYCGRTPPAVILEIDHINPKSRGGKNDTDNYLTACEECNRGKGAIPLDQIPPSLQDRVAEIKLRQEQVRAYTKYLESIEARVDQGVNSINDAFQRFFPNWHLSDSFISGSVKTFLRLLPAIKVKQAMEMATWS